LISDLAMCQYSLGHRAEAERAVEKVVALGFPSRLRTMGADLVYRTSVISTTFSDPALGVDLLKRYLKLDPDPDMRPFVHATLGIGYFRLGEIDASIRELEVARRRCTEKDRENASGGFFLAMAYHRKGDWEKARASYEKAVAWMKANDAPEDKFLLTTRAEAEALLGVRDRPADGGGAPKTEDASK
jgi:tetratricopeptide (TPR) repeat protein